MNECGNKINVYYILVIETVCIIYGVTENI